MNRTTFLAYARRAPFGGRLTQSQIDGINAILDVWEGRQSTGKLIDNRRIAYMLATVFHESGGTMQPVTENLSYSAERLTQVWPSRFPTIASAKPWRATRASWRTRSTAAGWAIPGLATAGSIAAGPTADHRGLLAVGYIEAYGHYADLRPRFPRTGLLL